ncbi:MAG: hypothetical protein FGM32_10425 [Candidatus Kapabacteria bacterium]|nr:hypothetical protein [Candidatus Kapabacteria bacterium]
MNNRIRASVCACISCLCLFLSTVPVLADVAIYTKITREGGRDNGTGQDATYDVVDKTIVNVPFLGTVYTSIACSGPGAAICPQAVVGPGRPSDDHTDAEQAGVDYALNQIRSGNLSGSTGIMIPGNPNVKQVRWSASGESFCSGSIYVWSWGTPQP